MRKTSMKKNAKKFLALGLAAAMAVPASFAAGTATVSADAAVTPVRYYDMEYGFRGTGVNGTIASGNDTQKELDVLEYGKWMQYKEYEKDGLKPLDKNGKATGEYEYADTVLVEGTFNEDTTVYQKAAIPAGAPKQMIPDHSTKDGTWNTRGAGNQAVTAYDDEKGNVFWLGETMTHDSYPSYATTVDWENGTYDTNMDLIVKDPKGSYIEFEIINSVTEFVNPYAGTGIADGFTFSTWIKNTTPYKEPVTASGVIGDVTGDGEVKAEDALAVLKDVANMEKLGDDIRLYGDVDNNGKITAEDALSILKFVAHMINAFERTSVDGADAATAALASNSSSATLDNTEILHFEDRGDAKELKMMKHADSREYLYFTANSIVYVNDYTDNAKTCTWELSEEAAKSKLNLLDGRNGGSWNYLTYSFDGTNFHIYVNGQELDLVCKAAEGYTTAVSDLKEFMASETTKSYFGGLGGGMQDNFQTLRMDTSEDYYLDDMALYNVSLDEAAAEAAYAAAKDSAEAQASKTANTLKKYDFNASGLAANGLSEVKDKRTADKDSITEIVSGADEKRDGNILEIKPNTQNDQGALVLNENPFANKDLQGVTISYWVKALKVGRSVKDTVLFSLIDEAQLCMHEKVGDNYIGGAAIARSQLSVNLGMGADYMEGLTQPIGGASLKNNFSFRTYTFGDPETQTDKRLVDLCEPSWTAYKNAYKAMGTKWSYVTITINNSGIKMYLDGVEQENKFVNNAGNRFYDGYWDRIGDAFQNGTNNSGAKTLMEFITDPTTKLYLGLAFEQGTEGRYTAATHAYLDDLTFFDADMSATEVKALYDSVK